MFGRFRSLSTLQRYLAAVSLVVASDVVRWFANPLLGTRYPYLAQYAMVVVAGRYFGFGPAMLALVLASFPPLFGYDFITNRNSTEWFWVRISVTYGLGTLLIWTGVPPDVGTT